MNQTVTMQVNENWQGKTLEQYLKKELHLTAAQIRSLKFRENGILRNGERCRVNQILQTEDLLEILIQEERSDCGKVKGSGVMPEIFYEDRDVVCVWKPAGRVTHPVAGHRQDTVAGDLVTYFTSNREETVIHCIGRLDKDTSGILVFARNRIAAARLWEQKEQGVFIKEYLAWCQGEFPKDVLKEEQVIDVSIGKAENIPGQGQKMQVQEDGKQAVTHYQVLRQQDGQALVRLWLETGRTHQIRVHMAYIGHPLMGDPLYGSGIPHQDAARLCAWKVRFLQPFTGEEIVLEHCDPMYQV